MIAIFYCIVFSVIVGIWSEKRGRSFWYGFLWSILLSPIIGSLIVLVTTDGKGRNG